MGGSVCLAVKKNNQIFSGEGYKSCSSLGASLSLLNASEIEIPNLLSELLENYNGEVYPVSYGLVTIDLDKKIIRNIQGYSHIGKITYGYSHEISKIKSIKNEDELQWHEDEKMIIEAARKNLLIFEDGSKFDISFKKLSECYSKILAACSNPSGQPNALYLDFKALGFQIKDYHDYSNLTSYYQDLLIDGWKLNPDTLPKWTDFMLNHDADSQSIDDFLYSVKSLEEKKILTKLIKKPKITTTKKSNKI